MNRLSLGKVKIYTNVLFILLALLGCKSKTHPGDPSGHLDSNRFTVFAFSQTDPGQRAEGTPDAAVFALRPDMNIRAWQKWSNNGLKADDYDFDVISAYSQNKTLFIGGGTAAALFETEVSETEFLDMVNRDALNEPNAYENGRHNGSFANPKFRDHIFNYIALQIDGGVDGIFLDEVLGTGCAGGPKWLWNGNECYDDHHLADFNRYLLTQYPEYSAEDWQTLFEMTEDNYPRNDIPAGDLTHNFNYRIYLATHGWQNDPRSADNLLAKEWGFLVSNRGIPLGGGFLDETYLRYWQELVVRIRDYARVTQGKEIYLTSNGIFPYVDFNSFGLYDYNVDDDGEEVQYVPVKGGHLDGSVSLQTYYQNIFAYSQQVSGNVPVILFIDWPTQMMTNYINLPAEERKDFWRIYMAEAYANGLFFAMHLKTSLQELPTAEDMDMVDFFVEYAQFYRDNAYLYHDTEKVQKNIAVSANQINTSLWRNTKSGEWYLHLNNHNYDRKIEPQDSVVISLAIDSIPKSVVSLSPDHEDKLVLPFEYIDGTLNITLPQLNYYTALIIETEQIVPPL